MLQKPISGTIYEPRLAMANEKAGLDTPALCTTSETDLDEECWWRRERRDMNVALGVTIRVVMELAQHIQRAINMGNKTVCS